MSNEMRTWLIAGCLTALGRTLAETLIGRGERVYATHDNADALKFDVTSMEDVSAAVAAVENAGGVDVLVNNAAYGYLTAFQAA